MTVHGAGVCWTPRFGGVGVFVADRLLVTYHRDRVSRGGRGTRFRAPRRGGYGPFVVGVVAACLLLVGKFVLEFDLGTYGGIGLLIVASVWNSWPTKLPSSEPVQLAIPEDDSANQ